MTSLETPLRKVVPGASAKALENQLQLDTVEDLVRYYPRRYVKRGELTNLAALTEGEHVTVFAQVSSITTRKIRPKLVKTDVLVSDDSGATLSLTFFNQGWRTQAMPVGTRAFFAGKVERFNRRMQLTHPEVQPLDDESGESGLADFAGGILPIYPATKALSTFKIQGIVRVVLDMVDMVDDLLPPALLCRLDLLDLDDALRSIHRPKNFAEIERARHRLKWDEAFVLQAALAMRRNAAAAMPATPRRPAEKGLRASFDAALPFELTAGQRGVGEIIDAELAREHPMHRLLQGEVGSGKTIVALRAMLSVIDAGGQAALLAPTEVLAQQHHRSITAMLGPLALRGQLGGADAATTVTLLTGSMGQAARRKALLEAASGEAGIVVGTHALLQEHVQFADLGLVVVDEQHRFGVEQRDTLRAKAAEDRRPHVLVMTATPIPRTVAMTVYGDLDVATLSELPKGRAPIATFVAPVVEKPAWFERVWQRVREEVAAGHQAYVVCPRIGEDPAAFARGGQRAAPDADDEDVDLDLDTSGEEDGDKRRPPLAVLDVAPMLVDGPLAGTRLAILHGRLSPDVKDATMRSFAAGEIDVLVATTVIEVGVDVPNATAMVIVDADRFGVSQLHQLRGRVGRGDAPSVCLLVTELPPGSPGRERLDAVASTTDGFALSEIDLEQRREGTVFGEQQHGRSDLKLLSLVRDRDLIERARTEATALVEDDPTLASCPGLARAVNRLLETERAEFLEKT